MHSKLSRLLYKHMALHDSVCIDAFRLCAYSQRDYSSNQYFNVVAMTIMCWFHFCGLSV